VGRKWLSLGLHSQGCENGLGVRRYVGCMKAGCMKVCCMKVGCIIIGVGYVQLHLNL
jgi:hypothetical protein